MENPIKMDDLGLHYFRKHPDDQLFVLDTLKSPLKHHSPAFSDSLWVLNISKQSPNKDRWDHFTKMGIFHV